MKLARRANCFTAWIAILAVLLAALAPTMARALSPLPQSAMPWSEICTLSGTQTMAEPGSDSVSGSGSGSGQGMLAPHCPFCLTHYTPLLLPSSACDIPPAAGKHTEFFLPAVISPPPRFTGIAAEPRAPPAAS
ncbi:MAG: DUF2946 family protein [Sulfuritalea sp.]|nr:DUF2946 family protein [Sulfuritalea sp.]